MARPFTMIRKGQVWEKKKTLGSTPYRIVITGKAKGGRWKTVCTDRNTHSYLPFIITQKFQLVAD